MAYWKNKEEVELNVDLSAVNYIAFKGGGGKGIAYLGPIDVLEKEGVLPLRLPIRQDFRKKPGQGPMQGVIGISGTSAGAITAYLVALGLSADQIRNESGLLPPKKNPNYDPNASPFLNDPFEVPPIEYNPSEFDEFEVNPASQKHLAGENSSGFNFEHFLTKDAPSYGYRRAIVYNKILGKNEMVSAVDSLVDGSSRRLPWNAKNAIDTSEALADRYGLDKTLTKKVIASNKKKETKRHLKQKVFPSQKTGKKGSPEMEEKVKLLKRAMIEERTFIKALLKIISIFQSDPDNPKDAISRSVFKSKEIKEEFINNILYDQGLFPGYAIRDFFVDVTFRRLPVILKWDKQTIKARGFDTKKGAEEMTFREYFEWTGLDLVIGGLNVTNTHQRNFSVDCTPDFPVVGAVMMSMNIPGLFKPIYVDAVVNNSSGLTDKEKLKSRFDYKGYYVDAGLANNIPFHAFDEDAAAAKPSLLDENKVNQALLALCVQEGPDPKLFEEYYLREKPDPYFQTFEEKDGKGYLYKNFVDRLMSDANHPSFPKENFFHMKGIIDIENNIPPFPGDYPYNGIPKISGFLPLNITLFPMLGWILNTVLENTTLSQYREPGARKKVVDIYAYHIGITDFKADKDLTEFVIRRAREKTIKDLKLKIDPNTDFK